MPADDSSIAYPSSGPGRVDPTQIPLPPQSPQLSAVSFSSRSSASYESRNSDSSGSTAPTLNHHRFNGHIQVNGANHTRSRSSIDGLGVHYSPLSPSHETSADSPSSTLETDDERVVSDEADEELEDDNKKMRKEAISNRKVSKRRAFVGRQYLIARKIADLEITNKSLLAINTSLEAVKHRQAKEIRDLRRKLRESILVLPPSAYREAKSSLSPEVVEEPEDDEDEDEDDTETQAAIEGKNDEAYRRVKSMLEALIDSGRKALETKPEDFKADGVGITKVLSEEEARTWRGEELSFAERDYTDDGTTDDDPSRPLTPSRIAIPSGNVSSEEEVEQSILVDGGTFGASIVPPITVTPSPSP